MTDVTSPHEQGTPLDEVLRRLARIELMLVAEQMEGVEGNEPTDEVTTEAAGVRSVAATALTLAQELEQFIDSLGFANFRGSEFTPYWSRVRNEVRNSVPPRDLWPNIVATLAVLQRFRSEVGQPVQLLSTFRSADYNRAVGGATRSLHTQFRAIDFTVPGGTPSQWAARLRSFRGQSFTDPRTGDTFRFHGGIGVYTASHFVHVDTRGNDVDF